MSSKNLRVDLQPRSRKERKRRKRQRRRKRRRRQLGTSHTSCYNDFFSFPIRYWLFQLDMLSRVMTVVKDLTFLAAALRDWVRRRRKRLRRPWNATCKMLFTVLPSKLWTQPLTTSEPLVGAWVQNRPGPLLVVHRCWQRLQVIHWKLLACGNWSEASTPVAASIEHSTPKVPFRSSVGSWGQVGIQANCRSWTRSLRSAWKLLRIWMVVLSSNQKWFPFERCSQGLPCFLSTRQMSRVDYKKNHTNPQGRCISPAVCFPFWGILAKPSHEVCWGGVRGLCTCLQEIWRARARGGAAKVGHAKIGHAKIGHEFSVHWPSHWYIF